MAVTRLMFEIEVVLQRKPTVIIARQVTPGSFVLDDHSTLGGASIRPLISAPRALDEDGNPRADIFAFTLSKGNDRARFAQGQRVELVARETGN